jgi:hypothetical protein
MLGGHGLAVQPPSGFHGRTFDFLTFREDGLSPSEIDVFRRQVIQALMIPPCVVVGDELPDAFFQIAGTSTSSILINLLSAISRGC